MRTLVILIIFAASSTFAVEECSERQTPALSNFIKSELEKRIEKISTDLHKAKILCPSRIWPNYSLEGKKVIFHSPESKKAWLWIGAKEKPTVEEIEISKVPTNALNRSYGVDVNPETYEMTLLINLDGNEKSQDHIVGDKACNLAGHESFHFFEQFKFSEAWPTSTPERLIDFPVPAEARFLRFELTNILKEAYLTNIEKERTANLQKAKAIWTKWKKDYPEERDFSEATEIVEGSAMFVETMTSQISKLGCDVSEDRLIEAMKEYVSSTSQIMPNNVSIEVESYNIGQLSSLLLDLKSAPNWKEKMEKGVPPLEQLLSDVMDINYSRNEKSFLEIKKIIDSKNKEIEEEFSSSLREFRSEEFVKIAIPQSVFLNSSGSHEGEYRLTQNDNMIIKLNNFREMVSEESRFMLRGVNTFQAKAICPTQETSHVVLISKK